MVDGSADAGWVERSSTWACAILAAETDASSTTAKHEHLCIYPPKSLINFVGMEKSTSKEMLQYLNCSRPVRHAGRATGMEGAGLGHGEAAALAARCAELT